MNDFFELNPELLLEQSRELISIKNDYEQLLSGISSDLNGINSSWSSALSNNFSSKIESAGRAFSAALNMLQNSGDKASLTAESLLGFDNENASQITGMISEN